MGSVAKSEEDLQHNIQSNNSSGDDNRNDDGLGGKRSRASREQVNILEEHFKKDSQPNGKVREILAKKVNMSERTVQIWFQNRRAKIKLLQRKNHMALTEEALRQHCMAAYSGQASSLPNLPKPSFNPPIEKLTTISEVQNSSPLVNDVNSFKTHSPFPNKGASTFAGKKDSATDIDINITEVINAAAKGRSNLFPVSVLGIGSWQRMPVGTDDLVCSFNCSSSLMSWVIGDHQAKFRIAFSFASVTRLELAFVDQLSAELVIKLSQAPTFSILARDKITWNPCSDFTEDLQASHIFIHSLRGEAQGMRVQLLKLIELVPSFSSITAIKPTSTNEPSRLVSAAQAEAKRRQSASLVQASLEAKNFSPQVLQGSTFKQPMKVPPQSNSTIHYMAALALERTRNRSLSTPNFNPFMPIDNLTGYNMSSVTPDLSAGNMHGLGLGAMNDSFTPTITPMGTPNNFNGLTGGFSDVYQNPYDISSVANQAYQAGANEVLQSLTPHLLQSNQFTDQASQMALYNNLAGISNNSMSLLNQNLNGVSHQDLTNQLSHQELSNIFDTSVTGTSITADQNDSTANKEVGGMVSAFFDS